MKDDKHTDNIEFLGEFLRERMPSKEDEQIVIHRVGKNLARHFVRDSRSLKPTRPFFTKGKFWAIAVAAAAVLTVAVWGVAFRKAAPAYVESIDGSLERIYEKGNQTVQSGENLDFGDVVQSGSGVGAMLKLIDGSHIEMRSQSELSLERADDGVRIHLNNGSVIVNAARQPTGRHIYVQTKDVTVSVVGTVFLVNTEEAGSTVAVIEGEVRVQRGDREKNLLPGQQLATNPGMESRPLSEEISWSRNAEAHLTMLRQSTTRALTPPLRFDVSSIKPSNARTSVIGGCRGTDGKYVVNSISPDPPMGRCVLSNGTLQHLISFAYSPWPAPLPLTLPISGGPDWLKSDRFTVEASSADPTVRIPDLQRMLQNLLSDRFKLVLHDKPMNVSGYVLVVERTGSRLHEANPDESETISGIPGKITSSSIGSPVDRMITITAQHYSMSKLSGILSRLGPGPVLDMTNLNATYDFSLTWNDALGPSLFTALKEQLGLQLESRNVEVKTIVIDHAEKPLKN